MKPQKMFMLLATILFVTTSACAQAAQSTQQYTDMSRAERHVFISEQARRIAHEISGSEYQFTSAFEEDIKNAVTNYAERLNAPGNSDLRIVVQRGQANAALIIAVFKARNVSPLIGLYIPWIESEYDNNQSSESGAVGIFQFLPSTGQKFGLSKEDLLDVRKSADAAALYIAKGLETFKGDPMKEALALLSYNRGAWRTERAMKILLNDQNKRCSICALTADRSKLDETINYEDALYVPRFFAAAIIGENPKMFGLQMQPLSSN